MITKTDFIHYVNDYLIKNNKCSANIDINAKYEEFKQARASSDFINQTDSEDARYDAELDLIEEIVC